jgi:hypothetical protein
MLFLLFQPWALCRSDSILAKASGENPGIAPIAMIIANAGFCWA